MTDEADRQSAPIPPKVDLRKSGILRDKPPAKSETSRIPLEAAKPVARPAVPGLTIKPPAAPVAATPKPVIPAAARPVAPTARPAAPAAAVPVAPKPGTPAAAAPSVASAAKRKTSRISLEAALSAEDKPAAEGTAPKTIRLKRAGDPSAVKQADTAAAEDGVGGTVTRRKTIRVKRPTQRPGVQAAAVARPAGGGAALRMKRPKSIEEQALADLGLPPLPIEEPMSPAFPVLAIVATIISCVLVYLLASQAFGPGPASSWKTGPDLPWAGKVSSRM